MKLSRYSIGFLALGLCVVRSGEAVAQMPASSSKAPIEISADKDLVWNRKAKTYTAHSNVLVKQNGSSIHSETLTAFYDGNKGAGDISRFEAEGGVEINAAPYTAHGDKAVYHVGEERAVLTGGKLDLVSDNQKLTATDKIEYFGREKRMTAQGNATAYKDGSTLTAPVLNGYFTTDAQGKTALRKVTAKGGVVIKTQKEVIHGDDGVYDIATQKAQLTGNVKIYQGQSWLQGTRVDVDMRTGISKLTADGNAADGGDGRVKGVFYPSEKSGG